MNWEASRDDDMIDIRIPGRIRLPDRLLEAILFLLAKAGYKCKLTIMPVTRYNYPEPPSPVAPNPYIKPYGPDYKWEDWNSNITNYPQEFKDWINQNSTAKESK